MSFSPGRLANTAMRVPSTMRALPLWAASQLLRRCGFVIPLCSDTTAPGPKRGAKRPTKRSSSWGVRLISGTITRACAVGSASSISCTQRKYTSVLPLPVLPNSRKGPFSAEIRALALSCSGVSAMFSIAFEASPPAKAGGDASNAIENIALTPEQESAKARISAEKGPFLLFGSTGSGKTEVYLRCVQEMLEADPTAKALVMVPEINLTPQLEERFVGRFAPRFGPGAVVSLHSGMTNPQRLKSWLAAHSGSARIVLGTRMAVFASLPGLKLIVVDEEHDPSYKQQEGARY